MNHDRRKPYSEIEQDKEAINIILQPLREKRKSLGLPFYEIAYTLALSWKIKPVSAISPLQHLESSDYWAYTLQREGWRKDKSGNGTRIEVAAQRMSDFLAVLGYKEQTAKNIFEQLSTFGLPLKYISSSVQPLQKDTKEVRTLDNSLDSLEGLGEFAW